MASESETMLPCPFCGNAPVEHHGGSLITGGKVTIRCESEDCAMQPASDWTTRAEAIGQWSKRAPGAEATLFDVAIETLNQIADRPRNAGARRNARATLRFIETQIDAIAQQGAAQEVGRG